MFFFTLMMVMVLTFQKKNLPAQLPKEVLFYLLFYGWILFSSVQAVRLDSHIFTLIKIFSIFLFSYLTYVKEKHKNNLPFGKLITLLATIEVVFLIIQYKMNGTRQGLLMGNSSYSAVLIACGFLYVTSNLDQKKVTKNELIKIILGLFFFGLGLYLTRSRSLLVGLLVAYTVFILNRQSRILSSLLLLVPLIFALTSPESLVSFMKLNSSYYGKEFFEPNIGRLIIWKSSLLAIYDKFLLGYGFGGFETAYYKFQQAANEVLQYEKSTQFSHNDYLQVMVAGGLPAFLFLCTGLIFSIRSVPSLNQLSRSQKWSLSVILLFLVSSLFQFNFFLPFNALIFSGCFAILMTSRIKTAAYSFNLQRIKPGAVSFVAILVGISGLYGLSEASEQRKQYKVGASFLPLRSDLWYKGVLKDIRKGDWQRSSEARLAIKRDLEFVLRLRPTDSFAWARYANFLSASSSADSSRINQAYERAQQLAPFHAPFYVYQGFFLFREKELSKAHVKFQKAVELEPRASLPRFGLAISLLAQGKKEESIRLLNLCLTLNDRYKEGLRSSAYGRYLFSIKNEHINQTLKNIV